MRNRLGPVWFETMPLDPLYWQQWDRHFHHTVHTRFLALHPYAWGFQTLELDRESLARGQCVMTKCSGVMPDGLLFDAPGMNRLPPPRSMRETFPPAVDRLDVFLAVPSVRIDAANCQLSGPPTRPVRFSGEEVTVPDDNTGRDERPIVVAQPNLTLLLGGESQDGYTVLRAGCVVRSAGGGFELDESAVPPSLAVRASRFLTDLMRRILDKAIGTAVACADRRRQQAGGQMEFTPADMTALGGLLSINRTVPVLTTAHRTGVTHPFALYEVLCSLAGELTTFSADQDTRASDLPAYNHEQAGAVFGVLREKIERLLDTLTVRNVTVIPLRKEAGGMLVGEVPEVAASSVVPFFLAATGDVSDTRLQAELPKKLKMASQEELPTLLASALPGVILTGPVVPPPGLQVLADRVYFRVETAGPLWDVVLRTRRVAVFCPPEYRSLTFSLYAVNDR